MIAAVSKVGVYLVKIIMGKSRSEILVDPVLHELLESLVGFIASVRLSLAGGTREPFQHLAHNVLFAFTVGKAEIGIGLQVRNEFSIWVDETSGEAFHQAYSHVQLIHSPTFLPHMRQKWI